ncbi:STAS domain-containing protein [Saprospira sp. CCB-QB6]|uniref:STAS domain-containing protein n=1 Tax=Saprospira sp. CCB-QB6 TaxID=3023936 RepID=UPI002348FC67|nr:STAS domain-containing protein [Saprospira sp. CCB-QB6]WCL83061.1 STAS domain-containing protein [Saprospira sp. CCB-QB6]
MKVRDISYYKRFYFITDEALAHLAETEKQMEVEMRQCFDEVYELLRHHPEYSLFYIEQLIPVVQSAEKELWLDITAARYDDRFVASCYSFGQFFAASGLPLKAHLESLMTIYECMYNAFKRQGLNDGDRMMTMNKMARTTLDIISEVDNNNIQKKLEEQNDTLRELSTPVAEIWNGILLLPLVGFIDSKRAKDMMETMLSNVAEKQAKVFILDISGVAIVDTAVANHLIKMTKASRLMGCDCIISGISGPIAQTIVELGIQIDEIETTGSMRDALALAMKRTG